MIGYHYTSWENYQKIKKEGLIPYLISHPDIKRVIPRRVYGIFTWKTNHSGEAHLGDILFQMSSKDSRRIVKLSFEYNEKDILRYNGMKVSLYHYGSIVGCIAGKETENSHYHNGEEAWIITKSITPFKITLIKEYNLLELLQ